MNIIFRFAGASASTSANSPTDGFEISSTATEDHSCSIISPETGAPRTPCAPLQPARSFGTPHDFPDALPDTLYAHVELHGTTQSTKTITIDSTDGTPTNCPDASPNQDSGLHTFWGTTALPQSLSLPQAPGGEVGSASNFSTWFSRAGSSSCQSLRSPAGGNASSRSTPIPEDNSASEVSGSGANASIDQLSYVCSLCTRGFKKRHLLKYVEPHILSK